MIKTAVIGASGYIGKHFFDTYRRIYPDVIGTGFSKVHSGLMTFDLRNPDVKRLRLEETNHQAILISSAKPNVNWCDANVQESYALNVKGTLKLVEQLAETNIHIMFFSSDYVFNGEKGQYSDKDDTCPNTEYGRQKAEVEHELPNLSKNYTILRLSKIYGTTWQDKTLIDLLASDLINRQKMLVATDQYFSPTHADDVVKMVLHVQEENIRGLVNLCHSNRYSRHMIATKLADALNISNPNLHAVCLHDVPGMEQRPLDTSIVCSPMLEALQSSLVNMDDAIKKVAGNWNTACKVA